MKNLSNQTRLQIDETSTSRKYWDSKSKETGFEDIEDFLKYFELHTKTPRALFSGQHTDIILALEGYSQEQRKKINPFKGFMAIKFGLSEYKELENRVNSLI